MTMTSFFFLPFGGKGEKPTTLGGVVWSRDLRLVSVVGLFGGVSGFWVGKDSVGQADKGRRCGGLGAT